MWSCFAFILMCYLLNHLKSLLESRDIYWGYVSWELFSMWSGGIDYCVNGSRRLIIGWVWQVRLVTNLILRRTCYEVVVWVLLLTLVDIWLVLFSVSISILVVLYNLGGLCCRLAAGVMAAREECLEFGLVSLFYYLEHSYNRYSFWINDLDLFECCGAWGFESS